MRQPEFGEQRWRPRFHFRWTWTTVLIVVNVVVFIIECLACGYPPKFSDINYFALSVEGVKHFYVWQFLTFQFMHAGVLHILLNSLAIFFFGRVLEAHLGAMRFLALYFACGVIGGVFQVLGGNFWPDHFGTAVVGASAGGMGLMAAFAALFPEQPLTIFLYFIPVTTRAKYIMWGLAVFSILGILFPGVSSAALGAYVANGAHLGGMVMGWLYVKVILNRALLGVAEEQRYYRAEPAKAAEKSSNEFPDEDVDAILDKISARGINSLTTGNGPSLRPPARKWRSADGVFSHAVRQSPPQGAPDAPAVYCVLGIEFSADEGVDAYAAADIALCRKLVPQLLVRDAAFFPGGNCVAAVFPRGNQEHHPPGNRAGIVDGILWRHGNLFANGRLGLCLHVHVGLFDAIVLRADTAVAGGNAAPVSDAENRVLQRAGGDGHGGAGQFESVCHPAGPG